MGKGNGDFFRVVVDARTLAAAELRGIGRSLWCLYSEIWRQRPAWQVVLVHRGGRNGPLVSGVDNVREHCVECVGDRWDLWGRLRLPLAAWRLGGSVLHAPANTGPERSAVPLVLTIHDTIPLEPSAQGEAGWNRRWRRMVGRAASQAARILTPSVHSRDTLVERLGVDAEKIVVCPWAADPGFKRVTDAAALEDVRERYGIDREGRYVVAFGAGDGRKNTSRLIEAWGLVSGARRRDWQLVLVGIQGGALAGFREQVDRHDLIGEVLLTGFAPTADVVALLSGAEVMAYPSLSEGFGLPVLEGFACGTAVLSSDVTSLPEVAGDAALLVDPRQASSIAAGLERLLGDDSLRRELVARGYRRSMDFSWSACAATTCLALEAAGG